MNNRADTPDLEEERLQHLYLSEVSPNGKVIGAGAYGRVFEVECCGSVFAAKEIHPILMEEVQREESESIKRAFLNECVQSMGLGHPNIVTFLGVCKPGNQSLLPALVMERRQESLKSFVEKYLNISMCVKLSVLLDVSQGLWYLHTHRPAIVHRDLSPNNILLNSHFVAKISDLGVAKVIEADCRNTKTLAPGTVDFMPPEALVENPKYGPPFDVFSYGGIILHVTNQKWPTPLHFVTIDPETGKRRALSEIERRQEHIEEMSGIPADLLPLVNECLDDLPASRPPISDVSERIKVMKETQGRTFELTTLDPNRLREDLEPMADASKNIAKPTDIKIEELECFKEKVTWKEAASLPLGCTAQTAVLLQGNIYVGGGSEESHNVKCKNDHQDCHRLNVYNLTTNQWSYPITTPYSWFALTVLENKLIIVGGVKKKCELEIVKKILVLNGGHWEEYNELPTAKYYATAVGYQSKLIVIGGATDFEAIDLLTTVEILDSTNGSWHICNNLPSPHCQMKAVIVDNKLYLLGGFDDIDSSSQVITASLDSISTYKLNWQSLPNTPWHYSSAAVLHNKFLIAIGGRKSSDNTSQTREVHVLNPSTGLWESIAKLPGERSLPAVVGTDNKIIVIGGTNANRKYSKSVWVGHF